MVEHFFTVLLVIASIAIVWFAGFVVYRMYRD